MADKHSGILMYLLLLVAETTRFKIQWYLRELRLAKNWHGGEIFLTWKIKFWQRQYQVILKTSIKKNKKTKTKTKK